MTGPCRISLATWSATLTLCGSLSLGACDGEFVGNSASAGTGGTPSSAGATATGGSGAGSTSLGGTGPENSAGSDSSGGDPSVGGAIEVAGAAGATALVTAYQELVLAEMPLVYWRMGEAKQGVVADISGHGNDLVLQGTGHTLNAPGALHPDEDDGAIEFDGAASFAIATDARALDFIAASPFTLECWVRRRAGGASYFQHIFSNVNGVAGNRTGYSLYLLPEAADNDTPRSVFEYDRPAADLGLWGEVANESAWGHYVAVFDGVQAQFYVNGTLADTEPVVGLLLARTGPFTVARASDTNGSFFKGTLDELAIYPRAFSAKVVSQHFSFGK